MDQEIKEVLQNAIIIDCCIFSPVKFALMAVKNVGENYDVWSGLPPADVVVHNTERDIWGGRGFGENTFKYPKLTHTESADLLVVDTNGEVYYLGIGEENKHFEDIGIPGELAYYIEDVKNVHGTIYAVGVHRSVVRRVGEDQWESISAELHEKTKVQYDEAQERGAYLHNGFDCIDGFAADRDLYAAGGDGDVWRYDGEGWSPIDLPLPKMQIKKICCAEDGYVYITGRFGVILKGREDEWRIIKHDGETEFNDVASYKGKIYLASSSKLYEIAGDRTELVNYGQKEIPRNHGHLYVNHDLMMTAGSSSAAIFDGERWKVLYGAAGIDEETAAKIMSKILSDIADDETK